MIPVSIVIIIAGFYLVYRISLGGAFLTGIAVALALTLLESFFPTDPEIGLLTRLASLVVGAVPVYMLASYCDGVWVFVLIVAIGSLLLLVGGPIEGGLMLMK